MTSAQSKSLALVTTLLLTTSLFFPKNINAVGSCTATVSPSSVYTVTDTNFSFSVTNTGALAVTTVKIIRPSDNFNLENYGVPGWSVSASNIQATLTGGTVAPSTTFNFSYHGISGSSEAPSADWQVSTNDGTGEVACTGTLGTAIAGQSDTTAPNITEIGVGGLTSSGAVIAWTTSEAATSVVNYETAAGESGTVTGSSGVISHSVTLSGLRASTTYYYSVCSTDSSNNEACSVQNNFTTSAATTTTATATPTPATSTTTTTTTATATATPKPSDLTKPTVSLTTDFSQAFESAPLVEGNASDNNTLSKIEYSMDSGLNWLPVDDVEGLGTKSATFSFTPDLSEDGNYEIRARAVDSFANIGESEPLTLIIDRLPPRVGGNLLSMGPLPLLPNKDGIIITMANLEQRITFSAVGGPTSIDLLANDRMYSLSRSVETGLWTGTIVFDSPGLYQLKTRAVDGAGNITERDINAVAVLRSGSIIDRETNEPVEGAKVNLYYQDPESEIWTLWDAKSFGQENPQNTSEEGHYEFFLPPGTYYLEVKAKGYATLTSQIFTVGKPTAFNADFEMKKARSISIGPLVITLPDFSSQRAPVVITTPNIESQFAQSSLLGQEIADFSLPTQDSTFHLSDFKGNTAILSFISSWSPPAIEQISIMDDLVYDREIEGITITTQENPGKIAVFLKRGGYKAPIAVDRDGDLVDTFKLTSLPTHYFLSRTGVVKRIVTGVLTSSEIKDILANIN